MNLEEKPCPTFREKRTNVTIPLLGSNMQQAHNDPITYHTENGDYKQQPRYVAPSPTVLCLHKSSPTFKWGGYELPGAAGGAPAAAAAGGGGGGGAEAAGEGPAALRESNVTSLKAEMSSGLPGGKYGHK